MPAPRPHLLLLNASLAGAGGNTAVLLAHASRVLAPVATVTTLVLAELPSPSFPALSPQLAAADGFLFGTGTHWDGWSSVLQRFLEEATPAEGTALWLGKPAACVISEHSTGGKTVLSHLQGVLVTLGCQLPPMSGLVLSRAAQTAQQLDPEGAVTNDLWCLDDLAVVCHNLATAATAVRSGPTWQTWPVDRSGFHDRWVAQA